MKQLDRFVAMSFLVASAVALAFFTGLYLLLHFFNRIGNFDAASAAFSGEGLGVLAGFCRYYAVNLPFLLCEMAPYAFLMGAMWTVQQMGRRNELVMVVTSGISLRRMAVPILLLGFLLALAFSVVREEVLPRLAEERHRLERMHRGQRDDSLSSLPMMRGGDGFVLAMSSYSPRTESAHRVAIVREGRPEVPPVFVDELVWRGDGWVPAAGARVEGVVKFPLAKELRPRDIEMRSKGLFMLSAAELKTELVRYPTHNTLRLLLHGHYAYPMRTLVLLLLGLPLVLSARRRSPWMAVGLALLLSVAFFALQSICFELARRDELDPLLGTWLPVGVFGGIGLLCYELTPT
ncbi:MAG: LptF/LptG family permease [Planctomycetes bacterium]|nr:LptF/LptG family permease [Planctomycetota bacterium]